MRRGLLAAAACFLAGCSAPGQPQIAYEYSATSGENQIDQTLSIENLGDESIAPRLVITPLDGKGEPIEGLRVNTAYGSDRGRRVVPGGSVVLEILQFEGARKRDVESVDVEVPAFAEVDVPAEVEDPLVVRYRPDGEPIERYGEYFETFSIENPYDHAIAVRVVMIEYDDPPEGETQQFTRVTPIVDGLVRIPAGGTSEHTLAEALRGRVGSVKAYLSR